eukprot:TRINITY_DN16985_c0_g1_i1.p1 TRINITY_DN16985_c0_g1~~TRINITY_DN16985_c0_g1_i1.p1  ORF type:complete len:449 (+),score=-156.16 TRINITY_DN16985_c0_g1_i1:17-1363(+)
MLKNMTRSVYKTKTMAWTVCLLAAIFYAYDFLLRVQPNILVRQLMDFYGTNAAGIGALYAAYYWVYTPLQIPAGLVVDRYSPRIILTASALFCTVGTLLFAEVQWYSIGLLARVFMGLGSAFAFIGALKLASLWLPPRFFAAFSGLATALGTVGALATNAILPLWVNRYGWQNMILITTYIGLGLGLLLLLIIRSKPEHHTKALSREFRNWGHAFGRLWYISKQWEFWINGLVGCFTFLPIAVLAGLWGTSFLESTYHMDAQKAALVDAIIFIGMSIGGPFAGWISDHIGRRKIPLYCGSLFSSLFLVLVLYGQTFPLWVISSILFLLGFCTGPQILVFSIGKEISPPRTTGTSTAFTNFLVTIGALIFAPLVGFLMVHFWNGALSPDNMPIYSVNNFRHSLLILPGFGLTAFLLLFFVPETYCKAKFKKTHGKKPKKTRLRIKMIKG